MDEKNISAILGQDPHILIVDDEPELSSILEEFVEAWGFKSEAINNPLDVADGISRRFYNVVLLDIRMPNKSGIELIPEIKQQSPDAKIIIMSAYAEKEIVIKALRLGAFDFLEKPFDTEILFHTIKRALDTQRTELEFRHAYDELKQKKEELLFNELQLKQANKQLMETNNALSVLAQNIDRTRKETEFQVSTRIRSSIMPLIEKFNESKHLAEFRVELDVLMDFMDDLLTGLSGEPQIARVLSATEFRVAALIKNGLTTDEIANHMFVSPCTVKSHRRNIRKKLKLSHSSHNLKSFLQSKFEEQGAEEEMNIEVS
jgi:FixJ family two-component response regulator